MKSFIKSVAFLTVVGVAVATTTHSDTANITATVTQEKISVNITTDGVVAYGTVPLNSDLSTLSGELDDTQTAENDGNVTSNFNIRGSDGADWTLSDDAIGENQYMHEFTTTGTFSGTQGDRLHNTTYKTLVSGIEPEATQDFDLKIFTPSESDVFDEQNVDVTVQAVLAD